MCTKADQSEARQKDVPLQALRSRVPQPAGVGRPPECSQKGEKYVYTLQGRLHPPRSPVAGKCEMGKEGPWFGA
ncbi:hypothetical protein SASPL_154581 [Salvia splendens]|uniref:Uncharacterized protein n=1 Tax=Salvia splendens TaxID=180675 RepID=A0A8X8W0D3_SALSN|nr:hypothetical protein SASPL_154581 [Salvia splendens]